MDDSLCQATSHDIMHYNAIFVYYNKKTHIILLSLHELKTPSNTVTISYIEGIRKIKKKTIQNLIVEPCLVQLLILGVSLQN